MKVTTVLRYCGITVYVDGILAPMGWDPKVRKKGGTWYGDAGGAEPMIEDDHHPGNISCIYIYIYYSRGSRDVDELAFVRVVSAVKPPPSFAFPLYESEGGGGSVKIDRYL